MWVSPKLRGVLSSDEMRLLQTLGYGEHRLGGITVHVVPSPLGAAASAPGEVPPVPGG